MNVRNVRRATSAFALIALLAAFVGCGKKEEEKPANSNYYSGPMQEKPKQDTAKKPMQGGSEK